MANICVIGAGVVGLSTAINIQSILPSANVKVMADRSLEKTTSIGAGGIFIPTKVGVPGVPADTLRQWSRDSWEYYSRLALSEYACVTGHKVSMGYAFEDEPIHDEIYSSIVYSYKELNRDEQNKINLGHAKYVYQVTTIITDVKKYLPWLQEKFKENGGHLEKRKLSSIQEISGLYDVVVNCTGLGSRDLVGDKAVHPIRGQTLRLHAPWISNWIIYADHQTYILPNSSSVVIGGTRQMDNYDLTINKSDRQGILERCYKAYPALQGAAILEDWVGLRPVRSPLRLEKEIIKSSKGDIKVVHNYGHGRHGIALSWGTAMAASKLVKEFVQGPYKSKL